MMIDDSKWGNKYYWSKFEIEIIVWIGYLLK